MPVSEIDIVGATGSSHSSRSPSPLEPLFHFPSTYDPSPSFLLFLAISLGRLTFHGLLTLYSEFSAGIFQTKSIVRSLSFSDSPLSFDGSIFSTNIPFHFESTYSFIPNVRS